MGKKDIYKTAKNNSEHNQMGSRFSWVLMGAAMMTTVGVIFLLLALFGVSPVLSSDEAVLEVSYTRDIAPILQESCQECHRPNRIGPFSLMTYEDARRNSWAIKQVTELRIMPPWHAKEGYGEFKNERMLKQEEIDTIGRWADAGAPEGNPLDLPPPRKFAEEWQLGTPDIVLDPGADFRVRKSKRDFFWSFVLPFNPKEDVWVSAIEVIPGASAVVHHTGLYVDPTGESLKLDKRSPGIGYPGNMEFSAYTILDFWTPGGTPQQLEAGTAWKIPADSHLVLDIHYAPDGKVHLDRTRVGLYLANGPVDKRVRFGVVGNTLFEIPAGERHYEVTASRKIPRDIHLVSGLPHMHYLGKEMKVWATLPSESISPMVWVPHYDFHWQQVYVLKQPLALPRDSRIDLVAYYDNSEENPHNPHRRPRTVYFGQNAKNEMCFFYFHYTVDDEYLTRGQAVGYDGLELRVGG